MQKTTRIILAAVLLGALIGVVIYAMHQNSWTASTSKLKVSTTYYPLYEFAKQVGGNKVEVTNITPSGSEPHDYEPTPRQLVAARRSDVFIYNGANLEPWVGNFLQAERYRGVTVKASDHMNLFESEDHEGVHRAAHGKDPHFWLDPVLAQEIVRTTQQKLAQAKPSDAASFKKNAAAYIDQLKQLDSSYKEGLKTCERRTIVTSHEAFSYLAKRYNLTMKSIAGVNPEAEPSAAKLAELSDLVKKEHITYIFFESLVSPRLADTIAHETGAKTAVLDPIEGISNNDQAKGKNYLSVQRDNLRQLRSALACQL